MGAAILDVSFVDMQLEVGEEMGWHHRYLLKLKLVYPIRVVPDFFPPKS